MLFRSSSLTVYLFAMPAHEIDEIFSRKAKDSNSTSKALKASSFSKNEASGSSQTASGDTASLGKKKKSKKRKRVQDSDVNGKETVVGDKIAEGDEKKIPDEIDVLKIKAKKVKRVVETVVDPSASVKSSKTPSIPIVEANTKANKGRRGEREDLDRFKDSRGTGPSESSFGSKASFTGSCVCLVPQGKGQTKVSWFIKKMN